MFVSADENPTSITMSPPSLIRQYIFTLGAYPLQCIPTNAIVWQVATMPHPQQITNAFSLAASE